jgi:hypothetical protein
MAQVLNAMRTKEAVTFLTKQWQDIKTLRNASGLHFMHFDHAAQIGLAEMRQEPYFNDDGGVRPQGSNFFFRLKRGR